MTGQVQCEIYLSVGMWPYIHDAWENRVSACWIIGSGGSASLGVPTMTDIRALCGGPPSREDYARIERARGTPSWCCLVQLWRSRARATCLTTNIDGLGAEVGCVPIHGGGDVPVVMAGETSPVAELAGQAIAEADIVFCIGLGDTAASLIGDIERLTRKSSPVIWISPDRGLLRRVEPRTVRPYAQFEGSVEAFISEWCRRTVLSKDQRRLVQENLQLTGLGLSYRTRGARKQAEAVREQMKNIRRKKEEEERQKREEERQRRLAKKDKQVGRKGTKKTRSMKETK